MDFDSLKAVNTVNYTSQTSQAKQSTESVKLDNNSATSVKEEKEIVKIKNIYQNLLSDGKETSNENDDEKIVAYSEKEVESIVKMTNDKLAPIKKSFEYSIHDVTKRMSIKILDNDTKEVIKEIPPEKVQNAIAKMWELAGLIVDEKR